MQFTTGLLLIVVPIAFNASFFLLQRAFEYPDILRQPTDDILRRFKAGGAPLRRLWYAFAVSALLFTPVPILVQQVFGPDAPWYLAVGTLLGVLAGVVQVLGLIRWSFLVPSLADSYTDPHATPAIRESVAVTFQAFHRYVGVAHWRAPGLPLHQSLDPAGVHCGRANGGGASAGGVARAGSGAWRVHRRLRGDGLEGRRCGQRHQLHPVVGLAGCLRGRGIVAVVRAADRGGARERAACRVPRYGHRVGSVMCHGRHRAQARPGAHETGRGITPVPVPHQAAAAITTALPAACASRRPRTMHSSTRPRSRRHGERRQAAWALHEGIVGRSIRSSLSSAR